VEHSLDSARDKLRRADAHFDALHAEAGAWLDSHPYEIFPVEQDAWFEEALHFEMHIGVVQAPPWELGLIFGDVLHNLRGVLDHLFWELVTRRGTPTWNEARTISFPIARTYRTFSEWPGIKSFRQRPKGQPRSTWRPDPPGRNRVTYSERLAIQRHQPYKRKDTANHPLAALREMNDRDKHQAFHPLLVSVEEPAPKFLVSDGKIVESSYRYGEPLTEGAHIADVWVADYGPNVDVQVDSLAVAIAFGDTSQITIRRLGAIRQEVAEVLAEFVTAFPP